MEIKRGWQSSSQYTGNGKGNNEEAGSPVLSTQEMGRGAMERLAIQFSIHRKWEGEQWRGWQSSSQYTGNGAGGEWYILK